MELATVFAGIVFAGIVVVDIVLGVRVATYTGPEVEVCCGVEESFTIKQM
jgi:hypothetical protein